MLVILSLGLIQLAFPDVINHTSNLSVKISLLVGHELSFNLSVTMDTLQTFYYFLLGFYDCVFWTRHYWMTQITWCRRSMMCLDCEMLFDVRALLSAGISF